MAGSSTQRFEAFYADLKQTEKKDAVLTPKQQIDRLLRPGSTYRNLNPYEVLDVNPEDSIENVKKKFRRLSILVHPDKNQDDAERAMSAFDAVKKAYSMLEDEAIRKKCLEVVEEAKGRTVMDMEERRKSLKRQGKSYRLEEDDPAKFHETVRALTTKLFADLELKRQKAEQKVSTEAARQAEEESAMAERRKLEKEFQQNWEESRQGRVNSWLGFARGTTYTGGSQSATAAAVAQAASSALGKAADAEAAGGPVKKKKKKEKFSPMGFRPPKHKPESR